MTWRGPTYCCLNIDMLKAAIFILILSFSGNDKKYSAKEPCITYQVSIYEQEH